MIKVTLKSLLARKLRFALTGLAVVIGVSFMAGTFMLTDSINVAFASVFTQPALGRATTVRARSAYRSTGVVSVDVQRAPIPDSLVATVTRVPGVKAAAGMVQGFAQMVGRDGRTIRAEKAPMLGTNWIADPDLSVSRLAHGRGPVNGDEVAVDAATFKRGGFHLGDRATVLTAHAPRQFTIVGSLSFGGSPSPGGATVIAFDGPTAQAMVGRPGAWDEIEVAGVRPGTSATVLTERIGAALPGQYEAVTSASVAAALAKSIQRALGRLPAILMVFAGVAVFAAVFIVYNSFAILVAQRSRELALLRAIGASRGQVTRSVVGEAALVGVMASGFGLALGALAALGLERVFTAAGFVLPATRLHLSARTVLVSAVTGTAVTVVSSILPARHASRVPPVAAMSEAEPGGAVRSAWPPILGAVVMAAGT
ncbi:MAG: ABC transporter permease, partial [Actinomycetota bacterium]|nr:ABC transporter permease [Actinomycetota bacterium]